MSDHALVTQFLENLASYVNSGGRNEPAYLALAHQSARVQTALGSFGVMAIYRPPFDNVAYHNYQIVVNMVPELRRWVPDDDTFSSLRPGREFARTLQDAILRYAGVLEPMLQSLERNLRNPFVLLREGVGEVLLLPIRLLNWFGLLTSGRVAAVQRSAIFRVAGGIATLVGFVSAVVGLITGWEPFLRMVRGWF
jgi:hypothetical protein